MKPLCLARLALVCGALLAFTLTGCGGSSDAKRLQAAKRHLAQKDGGAAVIELKNLLQATPTHAEARFLLGKTLADAGEPLAAEVELRRSLEAGYPENAVLPVLARVMVVLQRHAAMLQEIGTTRLSDPQAAAELSVWRAQAHMATGNFEAAQQQLDDAFAKVPRFRAALEQQARWYAARGEHAKALLATEELIAARSDDAEAWSLKGDVLMQDPRAPRADVVAAYRKALALQPALMSAHTGLIAHLLTVRQLDEARQQWQQLSSAHPRSAQSRFFEAVLALHKGNAARARELTQGLVPLAPDNPRVLMVAGQAELLSGSLLQAEAHLNRAIALAPQSAEPRRILANGLLQAGQPRRALEVLAPLVGNATEDPQALALAGQALLLAGDLKAAEAMFSRAARRLPDDPGLRTGMALAQLQGGNPEVGFDALDAVARSSTGTDADLPLINARLQRRQYAAALQAIDRYAAKVPDQPLPDMLRGRVALAQGDRALARRHWEDALRKNGRYLPALLGLADLDFTEGQAEAARNRLQEAAKRDPANATLLVAQAQVQWRSGSAKAEVVELLRRAARANANDIEPRLQLIDLGITVSDYGLALSEAQQASSQQPDNPAVQERLGIVQQLRGEHQQAVATFGRLVALQPTAPLPLLRLAEANADLGRFDLALQHARRAHEIAPDSAAAARTAVMMAIRASRADEAYAISRALRKRAPAFSWRLEGEVAREQADPAQAAAALRKSLALQPSGETARLLYEVLQGWRPAEADRFASEWLQAQPADIPFLLSMAYFAERRGDLPEAERRLRQVLAADAQQVDAINNLASVLVKRKQPESLDLALRASKLAPNRPLILDTLAQALAVAGRGPQALALQSRVVDYAPDAPAYRVTLARLQLAAGKKDEAAATIDRLLALGTGFEGHQEVKQLAESLRR